jgi:hypothetical protein
MCRRHALPLVFALATLTSAAGCASYVPFTQELRDQHNITNDNLKNLQFYNSHQITLRREVERGGSQVTPGHKLLVIAGKQIEEVVIEEHTPGVVLAASESTLRVSFDEGSSMEFQLRGPEPLSEPVSQRGGFASAPDPFPGNNPQRDESAERHFFGTGNYWLIPNGGSVTFLGQSWQAVGDTQQSHLVISTESLEEVEEERTVLKGRKL